MGKPAVLPPHRLRAPSVHQHETASQMKQILKPALIAIAIGTLIGLAVLWFEFGGVEENFLNYRP